MKNFQKFFCPSVSTLTCLHFKAKKREMKPKLSFNPGLALIGFLMWYVVDFLKVVGLFRSLARAYARAPRLFDRGQLLR